MDMAADLDIPKQVDYWRRSAAEDLKAANELIKVDHIRHGMFFVHLALEKALKASVCETTQDVPPRIHDLVRLAVIAGIQLSEEQINFLAEINPFNLEGRYPEYEIPGISRAKAQTYFAQCKDFVLWLTNRS